MRRLLLLLLASCATAPTRPPAVPRIDARVIAAHVKFLADDQLEGRKPGTRGSTLAIDYLAAQLRELGLDVELQKVPLVERKAAVPAQVTFQRGAGPLALSANTGKETELVIAPDGGDVALHDAPLVFAGYGIVAPEYGWDDYKGVDVRGKVVVLLNFNPPFAGERVRLWYGRWDYKYLEAARHGAAGALIVHTTESAGYPWQVLSNSGDGSRQDLPLEPGEPRLQFQGWIAHDAATRLVPQLESLVQKAQDKAFVPVPLDARLSLAFPVQQTTIDSYNVLGTLRGTQLPEEAVFYTAHHDHLGMVPGQPDPIYNGALDNASGCATVLAIARAAVATPPRRSLVFAFVTAEEQGLLGSRYLAKHPPFAPEKIAAGINLDSVNIWGRTTDLTMLGLGKSSLDAIVRELAASQGRTLKGDPMPDRGSFYRSDQFELARIGVPVAALKGGLSYEGKPAGWGEQARVAYEREHYHQPSDEYSPQWDLSGAVQDAELQLALGLRVANADGLPQWTPGDEFEKARKKR